MRDIELAGFVLTAEEWAGMDARQRAQLLRAALRRDEPWIAAPAPRNILVEDEESSALLAPAVLGA